jgi:hypothetical protein
MTCIKHLCIEVKGSRAGLGTVPLPATGSLFSGCRVCSLIAVPTQLILTQPIPKQISVEELSLVSSPSPSVPTPSAYAGLEPNNYVTYHVITQQATDGGFDSFKLEVRVPVLYRRFGGIQCLHFQGRGYAKRITSKKLIFDTDFFFFRINSAFSR